MANALTIPRHAARFTYKLGPIDSGGENMEASDEQQQVYNLTLLAEEQQKAAEAAVAAMAKERQELAKATEAMKQATKLFPGAVGDATALGIRQAIGDAPKAALGALNQARHTLAEASHILRDVSTSISFK